MTRPQKFLLSSGVAALFVVFGFAQYRDDDREQTVHDTEGNIVFRGGRLMRIDDGVRFDEESVSTARAVTPHSTDLPVWTNEPGFEKDVFTFCRLRYISESYGGWRQSLGKWTS
jgi:hypothetical protein